MEYFVYGRDRAGADEVKVRLVEEHWTFMDGYAEQLIARGPTLTGHDEDAESTGSLHIVDLPDLEAAKAFVHNDPYYVAGAFESVELYRFTNTSGRTMWEFADPTEGYHRFLVIALGDSLPAPPASKHLIVYGQLLTLDTEAPLGWAATVEAPTEQAAAALLAANTPEAHPWTFGGRR
ncbi:YciI family protein [Kribbella monticola]|uniref:YciI family protein n=1 Tax=Kribbella monticola TaxID=2185285 RepID=UPI000DD4A1D2|nr:YciI family protein [Kribbella monticola]